MVHREFNGQFIAEAAKGTPAVVAAAWTMNDVLVAVSIAYVAFQISYLAWKWYGEYKSRKPKS